MTFLKSNRIVWIPGSIFLLSLFVPLLFLSRGNSPCHTSPIGLDQSGDTYIFTKQDSAGCFIKGIDKKINFTVGSFAEKENHLTISKNGKKLGEWKIGKGIQNVSVDSESSISDLEFHFQEPIRGAKEIFLFQKKTLEYKIYHELMIALLVVSLAILVFRFRYLIKQTLPFWAILWFIIYSLYFIMLRTWPVPYIGDEPHYMLLGESLAEDRDLLLSNQYEKEKNSLFFRKFDHHTIMVEGVERPVHYPLLSLYISLTFLNQNGGAQAEPQLMGKVLMILVHSLGTSLLLFVLLRRVGFWLEYVFILPIVFGLPWLSYSNQIFPEASVAILLFVSYIVLTEENKFSSSLGSPLLFVAFPFLHIKFAPVAGILALYWIYKNRREKTRALIGAGLFGTGIVLFLLYNSFLYKNISPYGQKDLLIEGIFFRYAAYLFDGDRGLLALNPLLFFSIPGFAILAKRNLIQSVFLFTLLVFGHLPNVFHTNIWLGACPYGRYWIAVYPLIAFYSMEGLRSILWFLKESSLERKTVKRTLFYFASFLLLALSILQIGSFLYLPENYYTQFGKTMVASNTLANFLPIHLDGLYYSFFIPETKNHLAYWGIVLVLFIGASVSISKKLDKAPDLK